MEDDYPAAPVTIAFLLARRPPIANMSLEISVQVEL